jgi:hypothetical protein
VPTTRFIPNAVASDFGLPGRAWVGETNLQGDTNAVVSVGGVTGTLMRGLFLSDWRRQSDGVALSSVVSSGSSITAMTAGIEVRSSGLSTGVAQWNTAGVLATAKNGVAPAIGASWAWCAFAPLAFTLAQVNGLLAGTTTFRLAMTLGLSANTLELRRAYLDVTHDNSARALFIDGSEVSGVFLDGDPVDAMFLDGEQVW